MHFFPCSDNVTMLYFNVIMLLTEVDFSLFCLNNSCALSEPHLNWVAVGYKNLLYK